MWGMMEMQNNGRSRKPNKNNTLVSVVKDDQQPATILAHAHTGSVKRSMTQRFTLDYTANQEGGLEKGSGDREKREEIRGSHRHGQMERGGGVEHAENGEMTDDE